MFFRSVVHGRPQPWRQEKQVTSLALYCRSPSPTVYNPRRGPSAQKYPLLSLPIFTNLLPILTSLHTNPLFLQGLPTGSTYTRLGVRAKADQASRLCQARECLGAQCQQLLVGLGRSKGKQSTFCKSNSLG